MSESKKQSIRMAQEIALLKKDIFEMNGEMNGEIKISREVALIENNVHRRER